MNRRLFVTLLLGACLVWVRRQQRGRPGSGGESTAGGGEFTGRHH